MCIRDRHEAEQTGEPRCKPNGTSKETLPLNSMCLNSGYDYLTFEDRYNVGEKEKEEGGIEDYC